MQIELTTKLTKSGKFTISEIIYARQTRFVANVTIICKDNFSFENVVFVVFGSKKKKKQIFEYKFNSWTTL